MILKNPQWMAVSLLFSRTALLLPLFSPHQYPALPEYMTLSWTFLNVGSKDEIKNIQTNQPNKNLVNN